MTLNQIAYNVLNIVRGGKSFNDENISIEQIKYIIEYHRSQLIRRVVDKGDSIYDFEQDLGNITCIDASSEFQEFDTQNLILKTNIDIPRTIRLKGMLDGISFVGSIDRRFTVPLVSFKAARWQEYNRFTKGRARAFELNDRLYVIVGREYGPIFLSDEGDFLTSDENEIFVGDDLELVDDIILDKSEAVGSSNDSIYKISVRGVFERPREAYLISTGTTFDDDQDEYPLPYDLLPSIADMVLSGELKLLASAPLDTELNHLPDSQTN